MKLMIKVDDKGIISDVKFKTFGCGSAIASSSYMTAREWKTHHRHKRGRRRDRTRR
jgi:hypothetical protein